MILDFILIFSLHLGAFCFGNPRDHILFGILRLMMTEALTPQGKPGKLTSGPKAISPGLK